jgi:hypothetical protein
MFWELKSPKLRNNMTCSSALTLWMWMELQTHMTTWNNEGRHLQTNYQHAMIAMVAIKFNQAGVFNSG